MVGFVGTRLKKRPRTVVGRTEEVRESDERSLESTVDGGVPEFAGEPVVLRRTEHPISRKLIDSDALKVMYRLLRAGYKAYLVGGAVRDLMLGRTPKDYDIATDARPEAVRTLFRNSRIIGREKQLLKLRVSKSGMIVPERIARNVADAVN